FFYDSSRTALSPLSLHDALPILAGRNLVDQQRRDQLTGGTFRGRADRPQHFHFLDKIETVTALHLGGGGPIFQEEPGYVPQAFGDRKSTRLNSSHEWISYAVFCL